MKYKVIFLDIDNTLLDFNQTERYAFKQTIKDIGYIYTERIFKQYNTINDELWRLLELGKMDVATLKVDRFEKFVQALGINYSGKEMSKLYEKHLGECGFEIEGAYETCKELSKNYDLAIITNGIAEVQKNRLSHTQFHPYIKRIFISEEIGISKPDPGIFEYALKEMRVENKSEVLMVGDSITSDIKGSQNAGIDSCFFNPNKIDFTKIDASAKPTYEIQHLVELISLLEGQTNS